MSLNIAVFVPEGITIASDTLSFIKNNGDDGYYSVVQRTFCIESRYILSFTGSGYINGLPYGYYINIFLSASRTNSIHCTHEFADLFRQFISRYLTAKEHETVYLAGYDEVCDNREPCLLLLDRGQITRLNYDEQQTQILYNYHAVGNSLWINKLILPTLFKDTVRRQEETFQAASIDFSKYSLATAIDFAHFLLDLTRKMDKMAQISPSVNEFYNTARLTPWEGAVLL